MANTNIQIPFDVNGMQPYPYKWSENFHWKENYEFEDTLEITGFGRGRSSATFSLEDSKGNRYSMFMKDMTEMIKSTTITKGKVHGKWTFCKRGMNYGIRYIDASPDTDEKDM